MTRRTLTAAALAVSLLAGCAAAPADGPPTLVGLVVGDSIAVGAGTEDGGWRSRLAGLAASRGVSLRLEPLAVGQWTTADALPQLASALLATHPDFVLLAIGTNDIGDVAGFEGRYDRLIKTALDVSDHAGIFTSWLQYPAASWRAQGVAAVNDATFRRMLAYGYFATPRPARHPGWADLQAIPPSYLDGGGVHPTAAGYDVYAHIWYDVLAGTYGWPAIAWSASPPLDWHRP